MSNVLNGKSTVSPAYVARVRAAVAELGYVADPHASRLRSGRHALAGVVVPDLANPMFAAFVSTLERLARADGFDLLVVSAGNAPAQEAERLRALASWRPEGLVVIPCDGALAGRLPAAHPPVVVADRIPDSSAFDLVAVDNGPAAGAVAAHLAGQGRRHGLVACTALSISNVRERWEGARLGAGGMRLDCLEVGHDPAVARRLLRERLGKRPHPDALFALDLATALVAYRVLDELGLAVPGQIALAGFDEAEWMGLVRPPVTAVRQPVEDMARASWALLRRRMAGENSAPETVRLTCTLALRGSSLRGAVAPEPAAA